MVCKVNSIAVKTGKSNCTWSSCREGCTADMFKCFQVKRRFLGCVIRKILINLVTCVSGASAVRARKAVAERLRAPHRRRGGQLRRLAGHDAVGYPSLRWSGSSPIIEDPYRFDEKEGRPMMDTPLLVNIKGCGYPPEVDCAAFAIKYQVECLA